MMAAGGVKLNLLMGAVLPVPPPVWVVEALEQAEVAVSDSEPSGFSLVFRLGKDQSVAGQVPLLTHPAVQPGGRIVLTGLIGARMVVLIDGIIEDAKSEPGTEGAGGTLTLMGRDLTALMDKEEKQEEFPGMGADDIVRQILSGYAAKGIMPDVRPPLAADRATPTETKPVQRTTDLKYIQELGAQHDHVFMIRPGPQPGFARAYWGPPPRGELPQPAITVDMGPESNATDLKFESTPGQAGDVAGDSADPTTGRVVPVETMAPSRAPLSAKPALMNPGTKAKRLLRPRPRQSAAAAMAAAAAQSAQSSDTVKVTGTLNLGRYGRVLRPSGLVGLRGAGFEHDGHYYVRDVIHSITRGAWSQAFTLVRDGTGTTTMTVRT